MKIPFSPPDVTEQEARMVHDALLSGWITTGPRTKEFERQIAAYCGTDVAVCFNSATASMESLLRLLEVGPGDEVITSPYTYTATASVVCHVGATLVLVDVKPGTIELDAERLADAITERTKVVIPVDVGGMVCDYDAVFRAVESKRHLFRPKNDLQRAYGRVVVMADSAHSFGSMRDGKRTGSIADFSAFSFHAVKNLTTAEGGALTWRTHEGVDNAEVYHRFQLLSLHGQSKDAFAKTQLGAWEYDIVGPWYKCNMTDLTAAVGLVQLERYPAMLQRRREVIERYNEAFQDLDIEVLPHFREGHTSNGHLYMTRLLGRSEQERNAAIVKMAERDIACNVHFKPLPMMTAYHALGFDIKDFPEAYEMYHNELTLPLFSRLTDEQVEYVIQNFIEVMRGRE